MYLLKTLSQEFWSQWLWHASLPGIPALLQMARAAPRGALIPQTQLGVHKPGRSPSPPCAPLPGISGTLAAGGPHRTSENLLTSTVTFSSKTISRLRLTANSPAGARGCAGQDPSLKGGTCMSLSRFLSWRARSLPLEGGRHFPNITPALHAL